MPVEVEGTAVKCAEVEATAVNAPRSKAPGSLRRSPSEPGYALAGRKRIATEIVARPTNSATVFGTMSARFAIAMP